MNLDLSNTKKLFKEFCQRSSDLKSAKLFIDNIPANKLAEYKEIIFSERESADKNYEIIINIILGVFIPSVVSSFVLLIGADGNAILAYILTALFTFVMIFEVLLLDREKRPKRKSSLNLQRIFYYLENK